MTNHQDNPNRMTFEESTMTRSIKTFAAASVALAAIVLLPTSAWARPAIRVLYDDITNGYFAPADGGDAAAAKDNNGHGNNEDGVDSSNPGGGKDNNGHGNNADGVDSSNPGKGKGGPNGAVDESCDGTGDCVDDEIKNGGSDTGTESSTTEETTTEPAKTNNGKGKGKKK